VSAPPDAIELSLNEVETMALKAARGAGLPWGVAEDTGRSAAWLARHLGAWADSLLDLLERPPPAANAPLLLAGAFADGAIATAEFVMSPIWVLPPLLLGPGRRDPLVLRLGAAEVRCNPGEDASATLPADALVARAAGPVRIGVRQERVSPLPHALPARFSRSRLPLALWHRLERLAAETYVPASTESRLRGAGAGLLDDE
jgi:hypothetical protein